MANPSGNRSFWLAACVATFLGGYAIRSIQPESGTLEPSASNESAPLPLVNAVEPEITSGDAETDDSAGARSGVRLGNDRATAALDWMFGTDGPVDSDDSAMIEATMTRWAKRDPEGAGVWLSKNLDYPGADYFIRSLAKVLADSDTSAALEWVSLIGDSILKVDTFATASMPVLVADPDHAEQVLSNMEFTEEEQSFVRKSWDGYYHSSKRNAQNLVSVANAAKASGAELDTQSVESLLSQLTAGVSGSGTFATSEFRLSPLKPWQVSLVSEFVDVSEAGDIRYTPK